MGSSNNALSETIGRSLTILLCTVFSLVLNFLWIVICLRCHSYRQYLFFLLLCEHSIIHIFESCFTSIFVLIGSIKEQWIFSDAVCKLNGFSAHFVDGALLCILFMICLERVILLRSNMKAHTRIISYSIESHLIVVLAALIAPVLIPFCFSVNLLLGLEEGLRPVYSSPRYSCIIGDNITVMYIISDVLLLFILPLLFCLLIHVFFLITHMIETYQQRRLTQNENAAVKSEKQIIDGNSLQTQNVNAASSSSGDQHNQNCRQIFPSRNVLFSSIAVPWSDDLWAHVLMPIFIGWLVFNIPHLVIQYVELFRAAFKDSQILSASQNSLWTGPVVTGVFWTRFFYGPCVFIILNVSRSDIRMHLKRLCCCLYAKWKRKRTVSGGTDSHQCSQHGQEMHNSVRTHVKKQPPQLTLEDGSTSHTNIMVSSYRSEQQTTVLDDCDSEFSESLSPNGSDEDDEFQGQTIEPIVLVATSEGLYVQKLSDKKSEADHVSTVAQETYSGQELSLKENLIPSFNLVPCDVTTLQVDGDNKEYRKTKSNNRQSELNCRLVVSWDSSSRPCYSNTDEPVPCFGEMDKSELTSTKPVTTIPKPVTTIPKVFYESLIPYFVGGNSLQNTKSKDEPQSSESTTTFIRVKAENDVVDKIASPQFKKMASKQTLLASSVQATRNTNIEDLHPFRIMDDSVVGKSDECHSYMPRNKREHPRPTVLQRCISLNNIFTARTN